MPTVALAIAGASLTPSTHHRDLVLRAQLAYGLNLVLGHQVAPGFIKADFRAIASRPVVVAGDHDHAVSA